jgi:hypothetical protein
MEVRHLVCTFVRRDRGCHRATARCRLSRRAAGVGGRSINGFPSTFAESGIRGGDKGRRDPAAADRDIRVLSTRPPQPRGFEGLLGTQYLQDDCARMSMANVNPCRGRGHPELQEATCNTSSTSSGSHSTKRRGPYNYDSPGGTTFQLLERHEDPEDRYIVVFVAAPPEEPN